MRTLLSSLPFFLCMKYAFNLLLLWNFLLSSGFKYLNMMCLLVLSSHFLCLGFIEALESMDLQFSSFLEKIWLLFLNYNSVPQPLFCRLKNTYILGPLKLAYSSQILCSFSYLFPLYVLCWVVSVAMPLNSLIFSFAISNVILIQPIKKY